jgi:YggT family protein
MPTDLAELLFLVINILSFILIARALCSWFDPTFRSSIGRVLFDITEPLLAPIRQVVPPVGMLDLSILVAFFILFILRSLLASAISG